MVDAGEQQDDHIWRWRRSVSTKLGHGCGVENWASTLILEIFSLAPLLAWEAMKVVGNGNGWRMWKEEAEHDDILEVSVT